MPTTYPTPTQEVAMLQSPTTLIEAAEAAIVAALDAATAAIEAAATLDEASEAYFTARPLFRDGTRRTRAAALATICAFEAWHAAHPARIEPLVVFA